MLHECVWSHSLTFLKLFLFRGGNVSSFALTHWNSTGTEGRYSLPPETGFSNFSSTSIGLNKNYWCIVSCFRVKTLLKAGKHCRMPRNVNNTHFYKVMKKEWSLNPFKNHRIFLNPAPFPIIEVTLRHITKNVFKIWPKPQNKNSNFIDEASSRRVPEQKHDPIMLGRTKFVVLFHLT